jgi:large subunit ribosomal protein L3
MKRWGFKGHPASHGWSLSHRTPGSSGPSGLGKVVKGKKMPGRMGGENATTLSLRIFKIDSVLNLIYVVGSVPGCKNATVYLRDALRKPIPANAPFPTYYEGMPFPYEKNEFGEIYQPDDPPYVLT